MIRGYEQTVRTEQNDDNEFAPGMPVSMQFWFKRGDAEQWHPVDEAWRGIVMSKSDDSRNDPTLINVMPDLPYGPEPYATIHPRLLTLNPQQYALRDGTSVTLQLFVHEILEISE